MFKKKRNDNGKKLIKEGVDVEMAEQAALALSEGEWGEVLEKVDLPEKMKKEFEEYARKQQS